jgi:hypothetical protein
VRVSIVDYGHSDFGLVRLQTDYECERMIKENDISYIIFKTHQELDHATVY